MSVKMMEVIKRSRERGDFSELVAAFPYGRFLGFEVEIRDGALLGKLRYGDHLIGNAQLPALHGGTLGALLESTAVFELLWRAETAAIPKTINITVEYLRSARPVDTWARCEITRQGRRVANVRAVAWQEDPARPVAAANAHFLLVD